MVNTLARLSLGAGLKQAHEAGTTTSNAEEGRAEGAEGGPTGAISGADE